MDYMVSPLEVRHSRQRIERVEDLWSVTACEFSNNEILGLYIGDVVEKNDKAKEEYQKKVGTK